MKKWLYVATAVLFSGIMFLFPRLDTDSSGSEVDGARLDVGAPRVKPADAPSEPLSETPDAESEGVRAARQFLQEQLHLNTLEGLLALAKAYRDWAPRPELGPLRREILEAFARHESPRQRVAMLLMAVAEDPIAPEEDPNWELLVKLLAPQWNDPETYSLGRDLVLLVESERARRLVVVSLVRHVEKAGERITPEQRAALAGDLIDAYFQTEDEGLRQPIRDGIALLGGEELAEALTRREEETPREEEIEEETPDEEELEERGGVEPGGVSPGASRAGVDSRKELHFGARRLR